MVQRHINEPLKLSRGCCRLICGNAKTQSIASTQSKAEIRCTPMPFDKFAAVLISSANHGLCICQNVPQSTTIAGSIVLCYDNAAKIIPWKMSDGSSGTAEAVESLSPPSVERYSMTNIDADRIASSGSDCEDWANHFHAELVPIPIYPGEDDVISSNFAAVTTGHPIPLLSISLRRIDSIIHEDSQPLLHLYFKRQLAFMYIAFENEKFSTQVEIQVSDKTKAVYCVESVVAERSRGQVQIMEYF